MRKYAFLFAFGQQDATWGSGGKYELPGGWPGFASACFNCSQAKSALICLRLFLKLFNPASKSASAI